MKLKITGILALCFVLVACSVATAITFIDIAAQAAAVAAPIVVAAAGLPPEISTYVTVATGGVECAASVIEAGGTGSTVSQGVLKCLGSLNVAPAFPTGTPAAVSGVVQALANSIANILAQYTPAKVASAKKAGVFDQPVHLGFGDKRKLSSIHKMNHHTLAVMAQSKVF